MTPNEIIDYCIAKAGAYIDFPFGPDVTIVKVRKRIFAQIFTLKGENKVTLNCDVMTGEFFRNLFPASVTRGYHCPSVQQPYFNTITLDNSIENDTLKEMIEHSYKVVVSKLPKYIQRELSDGSL